MNTCAEKEKRAPVAFSLVFAILAVGIGASGYVSFRNYERQYRVEVEPQLSAVAELKVGELVQWRKERLGDAAILYKNAAFSALVARFLENPQGAEAQRQLEAWLESYLAYAQYDQARLLDVQGGTRLSVPAGAPPISDAVAQRIPAVLESGQVTLVDFYQSDQDQRVYLTTLVPILDETAGNRDLGELSRTVLGIVVLRIDPETYLYPYLSRWPTPSETAETLLIRRDGNDALFLNELKFQKNTALNLRIPLESKDTPAVKAALGQTGIVEGVDYRGVRVIADVRAVPDSPWFLVARRDTSEVYAPLTARLWEMAIFFSALLLGAGAGVVAVWRQQRMRFYRAQAQAAESLRESEERYRILFDEALDGICLADAETGRIIDCNQALAALVGRERTELIGQSQTILHPPDDDQAVYSPTFRQHLTDEEGQTLETQVVTRTGVMREVEIKANRLNLQGRIMLHGVFHDITERKQAEEALRESETKFRALFENMTEGVALHEFIYDESGAAVDYRILDLNPAYEKHTGLAQERARGMLGSVLYNTGAPPYWEEFERVARTGESFTFETYFPPMEKHFSISVICPRSGQFATVFEDITERRHQEEELRRKNEELERFTYTVSHDLKSPLVTVKTFMGYLEQDLARSDAGRVAQDLQYMGAAADKMGRLLDELLEMSRIGRVVHPPTRVTFRELADEALNTVAGRLAEQGVAVEVSDEPVTLWGDRPRLAEIWQNLVENAAKFMGDQARPRIELGAERRGEETVFFVRDNGVGIDPRYQSKVFGLFEKLDPKSEGTGLGLALVKRIVELHEGKIWVESSGPGQGATFLFTLPGAVKH